MIELTDEMIAVYFAAATKQAGKVAKAKRPAELDGTINRAGLAAVLAVVERDYDLLPRLTSEQIAAYKPRRRLRHCVENWPGAEIEGDNDPRCCRFPKSCSASAYDDAQVSEADLEPERTP